MAYFVTGATGFIGSYLTRRLVKRDATIYVLVRKGSLERLARLRDECGVDDKRMVAIVGDLAKPNLGVGAADLRKLAGKIDHVFHLAAIYDFQAPAVAQ
jgi:thioester reductase-like protein